MEQSQKTLVADVFHRIFQHLPIEVHIWELVRDPSGKIVSWSLVDANPAALQSWNMNLNQIKGKRAEEIFVENDPVDQFLPVVEKIFQTGQPLVWEEYFPSTHQTLEMTSLPIGEFFVSFGQDVSNRKRDEKQRKDILATTGVGIWRFDPHTREFDWDQSMYALLGADPNSSSNTTLNLELKPTAHRAGDQSTEDRKQQAKQLKSELQVWGEKLKDFDTTFALVTSSGQKRHIRSKAVVERDPTGAVQFVSGISMDRTHEIEAQELIEKERLKSLQASKLATLGELAAGVAHEINNPLSIISGCTALLSKQTEESELLLKNLDKIQRATERISRIVSGLRKFSRSDTELKKKSVPVLKLVEECKDLLAHKMRKASVELVVRVGSNCELWGDEIQIEQILINLLSNAMDAVSSHERPWVEVSYLSDNAFDCILVRDSGLGVQPSVVNQIFDPFFTTKEVGKGTGLGLAISSSIAKEHGGDLEYKLIDGHTAFVLRLPKQKQSD